LRSSPLPKLSAFLFVVAACVCAAAMWPTGALADTNYWIHIANEGQVFNPGQSAAVRYGAGDHFTTWTVSGTARCSNDFFGGDPLPNTVKSCDVLGHPNWFATEGQQFSTSTPTLISYGLPPDHVITRIVNGNASCTDDFFAGDPAYGDIKGCQIVVLAPPSDAPAPPPPPAPPAPYFGGEKKW
jgi:hypothetical protein